MSIAACFYYTVVTLSLPLSSLIRLIDLSLLALSCGSAELRPHVSSESFQILRFTIDLLMKSEGNIELRLSEM